LFADELLIMSMAATGLQQQLDAWQDFCSVTKLSRNTCYTNAVLEPQEKGCDLT